MKNNKRSRVEKFMVMNDKTPFAIKEAFNQLRTNLMYSVSDASSTTPVYGVSSTGENSGKSTILTNLAISFSQLDKKVLLIDGDMRCPVVHHFFNIPPKTAGLSELVSGIVTEIPKHKISENLDVITSGRIPPNPSELITSPRLTALMEEFKKEYDIIFIDFPPIGIVTDCIANRDIVSAYIFVVRAGDANAKEVNESLDTMRQVGARIAGVVLNDCDLKLGGGYKNYRYLKYTNYFSRSRYSRYSRYSNSKYAKAAKEQSEK